MRKKVIAEQEWETQNLPDEIPFEETAPTAEAVGEDVGGGESPRGEVESPQDELSALKASLEESEAKANEYLDGWQRSRAEFSNYKKRIVRDQEQIHQVAKGRVIKGFLDVLDDLERALENRPEEGEGALWAEGIELIYQKLQSKLEAEGLELMDAEGEKFDPNLHEALMQEENEDYESGQVIEVVQNGYWIGKRVLRPAQVRVAA